jgi:hypothetical protein
MLTGKVPFDADTPLAILMKHVNDPLPKLGETDSSIPQPLEVVLIKALEKDPNDRYQAAVELLQALHAAVDDAGFDISEDVSLLLPATMTASVFEPVAIFSGKSRQHISDAEFADGDTDVTFGQQHEADKKKILPASAEAVIRFGKGLFSPPSEMDEIERKHVTTAALASVGGLVSINIVMLWLGGVFSWDVWGRAWPLEIVMTAVLLTALMAALANPWFLIPVGIVMGNGLLFTYFAMTGWWQHWMLLWPLEPILIAVSIIAALALGKRGLHGRWIARRLAVTLLVIAGMVVIPVLVLSTLLSV